MSWDKVEKDVASGPLGLFKWFAIAVIVLTALFGGIRWLTMPADMAVQRIVTKQSFQYKEGMAQRGAILEANIAEVDALIAQHPDRRQELEAQKRVLRAQLKAITINN